MMNETKITKEGAILLAILMLLCALVMGSTLYGFIELSKRQYQKEFRK
jgi:CHASE3 domain sensor protein